MSLRSRLVRHLALIICFLGWSGWSAAEPYGPLAQPAYKICDVLSTVPMKIANCAEGSEALDRIPTPYVSLVQRITHLNAHQDAEKVSAVLQAPPIRQGRKNTIPVNRELVPFTWFEWQLSPENLKDVPTRVDPVSVLIHYVEGMIESVTVLQEGQWILKIRLSCIWACSPPRPRTGG